MDNYQDILYNKIINNISKTIKRTLLEQQHTQFLDGLDLDDDLENRSLINDRINAHQVYHPKTNKELKDLIKELFNKGVNDLNCIDVSNMCDFSNIFEDKNLDGVNISAWDVSNGIYFISMFRNARNLNCDLSEWDVSKGKDFKMMFNNTKNMNIGNIGKWNVSSAETFKKMFELARWFNCDISGWETENVGDIEYMFRGCSTFNQDLSNWKIIKFDKQYIKNMFFGCRRLEYLDKIIESWLAGNNKNR